MATVVLDNGSLSEWISMSSRWVENPMESYSHLSRLHSFLQNLTKELCLSNTVDERLKRFPQIGKFLGPLFAIDPVLSYCSTTLLECLLMLFDPSPNQSKKTQHVSEWCITLIQSCLVTKIDEQNSNSGQSSSVVASQSSQNSQNNVVGDSEHKWVFALSPGSLNMMRQLGFSHFEIMATVEQEAVTSISQNLLILENNVLSQGKQTNSSTSSNSDVKMTEISEFEDSSSPKQSFVLTPDLKHIAEKLIPVLNVVDISPVIDALLRWQSQTSIFHNDIKTQTLSNSFAEQVFANKPLFHRLQQSTQISLFQQYSSLFVSELSEKIMNVVWRLSLPDPEIASQFSVLVECFVRDPSLYIRTTELLMNLFLQSHNIGLEKIITVLNSQLMEKIRILNQTNSSNSFLIPSVYFMPSFSTLVSLLAKSEFQIEDYNSQFKQINAEIEKLTVFGKEKLYIQTVWFLMVQFSSDWHLRAFRLISESFFANESNNFEDWFQNSSLISEIISFLSFSLAPLNSTFRKLLSEQLSSLLKSKKPFDIQNFRVTFSSGSSLSEEERFLMENALFRFSCQFMLVRNELREIINFIRFNIQTTTSTNTNLILNWNHFFEFLHLACFKNQLEREELLKAVLESLKLFLKISMQESNKQQLDSTSSSFEESRIIEDEKQFWKWCLCEKPLAPASLLQKESILFFRSTSDKK